MELFEENLAEVAGLRCIAWDKLREKTIFITGATGLIGTTIIRLLNYANRVYDLNLNIVALVRDEEKANARFSDILASGCLHFVVGAVESVDISSISCHIDYLIHGASQTASREIMQHPVETIDTAVTGTKRMLELAKQHQVVGAVYLSSMEVYGHPLRGHRVQENEIGTFSPSNLRNCYPISKILCENMCLAYASEYRLPVKICRLTQTFGPDVSESDRRVFAYFMECVRERKNIVLKTSGETERSYLHSDDAAAAILTVLLDGVQGEAYNAADESTYCSIAEMAKRIADEAGVAVEFEIQPLTFNGYPDTLYMDLDTTKLKNLGWRPVKTYLSY